MNRHRTLSRSVAVVLLSALLSPVTTPVVAGSAAEAARLAQARPADGGFSLDLAGAWRFTTGDDLSWKDPRFDDSNWEQVQVPQEGGQAVFADYDGFAWFRLEFDLPAGAAGTPLVAALGGIDDADEAYLNGTLIGRTGQFPPEEDSQWFEQRLYPVPGDAPVYGGRNVLAVRMNDFTGGGGWYQGPVGLYSKEALRTSLYGLRTSPASPAETRRVRDVLARQAALVRDGRWRAYRRTLAAGFFHDGDTRARRLADLRALTRLHGPLRVRDTEVQVVRDKRTGALIADTNRVIVARKNDRRVVVRQRRQEFLYYAGSPLRERGNRSRFFMDSIRSTLEGHEREYAVYLPPSYLAHPNRAYPTIYLLHGINGGAAEWTTRDIDRRIDRLMRDRGIAEAVVVMPDAASLWYVDSAESPWRSMFVKEMVPAVDRWYRTKERRGMRGLTGVSMGGHGAFTIGWSQPQLFSSIASHMGALSLPPLAGSQEDQTRNAPEAPNVQVIGRSADFLDDYTYFFDACANDDFRFAEAARTMSQELTTKGVVHRTAIYPEGRHNDACWVPRLYSSFDLHSDSFRAHGLSR